MYMNVAHLLKKGAGATQNYPIDGGDTVPLDDETTFVIASGTVHLARTNRSIMARGLIKGMVTLSCARCLEPFNLELDVTIDEEFLPTIDIHHGTPLPSLDDDLAFPISDSHVLDLTEAVRQNVITLLPMQPLCQPFCAGLCPQCGTNQNLHPCHCADENLNFPFAHLGELLVE